MKKNKVTINPDYFGPGNGLYVIHFEEGCTTLGFDRVMQLGNLLAAELDRWDLTPLPAERGTMKAYEKYRMLSDLVFRKHQQTGYRSRAELTPQLIGLEGKQVEVVDCYGEKRRFWVSNPGRKTWRCFGACSEGGDVAKFLMKIDGISFPASLEVLARKGGINIPNGGSKEESERRNLLNVLRRTQQFYHNSLLQNQNGAKAYVSSRMTDAMIRQFGIGFAPVDGKTLVEYLDKERLPLDVAEKAGLIRKDAAGGYRDTFRGRVMFPIRDKAGYVIAFAGRTMSAITARCKYINSPETPLFRKSATLFGLDGAIEAMKLQGEVYVVEGYIDLMQMWSAGINNVVATCGTAFTREHAAILKRYVRRLNLMFDGDDAGRKAHQKAILLAVKEEMKATAFIFPEGQDPDSFYRNGGKTENLVTMSGFDFLKQSGVEMNATMQNLHRLERLENGVAYMARSIPDVARLLAKRGNLGELFSPEFLPDIEKIITHHGGART